MSPHAPEFSQISRSGIPRPMYKPLYYPKRKWKSVVFRYTMSSREKYGVYRTLFQGDLSKELEYLTLIVLIRDDLGAHRPRLRREDSPPYEPKRLTDKWTFFAGELKREMEITFAQRHPVVRPNLAVPDPLKDPEFDYLLEPPDPFDRKKYDFGFDLRPSQETRDSPSTGSKWLPDVVDENSVRHRPMPRDIRGKRNLRDASDWVLNATAALASESDTEGESDSVAGEETAAASGPDEDAKSETDFWTTVNPPLSPVHSCHSVREGELNVSKPDSSVHNIEPWSNTERSAASTKPKSPINPNTRGDMEQDPSPPDSPLSTVFGFDLTSFFGGQLSLPPPPVMARHRDTPVRSDAKTKITPVIPSPRVDTPKKVPDTHPVRREEHGKLTSKTSSSLETRQETPVPPRGPDVETREKASIPPRCSSVESSPSSHLPDTRAPPPPPPPSRRSPQPQGLPVRCGVEAQKTAVRPSPRPSKRDVPNTRPRPSKVDQRRQAAEAGAGTDRRAGPPTPGFDVQNFSDSRPTPPPAPGAGRRSVLVPSGWEEIAAAMQKHTRSRSSSNSSLEVQFGNK